MEKDISSLYLDNDNGANGLYQVKRILHVPTFNAGKLLHNQVA